MRTHQSGDQPPNPTDSLADTNEQLLDGADENYTYFSRVAKRNLLKDYFNHGGALCGQDETINDVT